MAAISITVIVPVRNGEVTLDECLASIRDQTVIESLEIIVLDSMSTDRSKEIAEIHGARVIPIAVEDFNHGLTRNIGVQHANGALIYFTVQDARIPNSDMLEKMSAHFTDETVRAVGGHQAVPHERDKNPLLWFRPYSTPGVTVKMVRGMTHLNELPVRDQQALVSWDNVVAMYRRSALLELPFVQTGFAEDWIWSYQALQKGWKLLHDSSLLVYHYHHHTFQYSFKVAFTVNYHFYTFFGYTPGYPRLFLPITKSIYHLGKMNGLTLPERFSWLWHNLGAITGRYLSTLDFIFRLKRGGTKAIESGYKRYCQNIPQGRQGEKKINLN